MYNHKKCEKLATVVLFSYNQEKFVKEAIEGALSQTYSPLEIIISDDCSTDKTWEVIQEVTADYSGSHKIIVRRNEKNLGINQHFNKLIGLVSGEYIIIMAGDDVSNSDRVSQSVLQLKKKKCFGLFSNGMKIDSEGNSVGLYIEKNHVAYSWLDMIKYGSNGGSGFSMAWRKDVIDLFSEIPKDPLGEDAFVPFRCALLGCFTYENRSLVKYRVHDNNISFWNHYKNAKGVQDRLNIAQEEMEHMIKMQQYRRCDIKRAVDAGVISQAEADVGLQYINQWINLEQRKKYILKKSFIIYTCRLIVLRRDLETNIQGFSKLRFWYHSLIYYYPKMYSFLHSILQLRHQSIRMFASYRGR